MKRIVEKAIPSSGVTQHSILSWLRDTIVPVAREIRSVVNSRFGEINTVTAEYTLTNKDEIVICNTNGGAYTVYLPPVIGWTKTAIIKRVGTGILTIAPNPDDSGVTIDALPNIALMTTLLCKQLVTDGYNWYVVSTS